MSVIGNEIQDRIESFKADLFLDSLSDEYIFNKHIIDIKSYLSLVDDRVEEGVKDLISSSFGVKPSEVFIIGSAKLGYSLSPKKLFREFDKNFQETRKIKDKSDIDIAIISDILFFNLQKKFYDFSDSFRLKWQNNEFYKYKSNQIELEHSFYKYNYKGWFRIDFKPSGFEVCKNSTYEELKKDVSNISGRKLGIAIYQNKYFFQNYHCDNISRLKLKLKSEVL